MNLEKATLGFFLSILFLTFFFYGFWGVKWILSEPIVIENIPASIINGTEILIVPPLEINAESVISLESDLHGFDKILFEKNSDVQLPIASLTKLMTAIIILDNYNLSDTVLIDKFADAQNPVKQDVKLGDVLPVESLLEIMLIASSNKSAYALAGLIGQETFIDLMNQRAKDIGLSKTFFADTTGLNHNNVSTAKDLSKLASYILSNKNYSKIVEISKTKELEIPEFGKIVNTDQLLEEIPDIVCSKTGFNTAAKGCLLLVIDKPDNNKYLINIILGADDRFLEMKKLISWSDAVCN